MINVLLETPFGIGDTVRSRIGEPGEEYIVIGFILHEIKDDIVIHYSVLTSDYQGDRCLFNPVELELIQAFKLKN